MSRAPWNNVLHPAAGAAGLPFVTASAAVGHRRLQLIEYLIRYSTTDTSDFTSYYTNLFFEELPF